jgi:hypothetical protein
VVAARQKQRNGVAEAATDRRIERRTALRGAVPSLLMPMASAIPETRSNAVSGPRTSPPARFARSHVLLCSHRLGLRENNAPAWRGTRNAVAM